MIRFFRHHAHLIWIIGGILIGNGIALYRLFNDIPYESVIAVIGGYGSVFCVSVGLILLGIKVIVNRRILGSIIIMFATIIIIILLVQLTRTIFFF